MNTKMENIRETNLEEMEKVSGGTDQDTQAFLKHLHEKYGINSIRALKKLWTQEEREYFERAYDRKDGDEPLGPYPD